MSRPSYKHLVAKSFNDRKPAHGKPGAQIGIEEACDEGVPLLRGKAGQSQGADLMEGATAPAMVWNFFPVSMMSVAAGLAPGAASADGVEER